MCNCNGGKACACWRFDVRPVAQRLLLPGESMRVTLQRGLMYSVNSGFSQCVVQPVDGSATEDATAPGVPVFVFPFIFFATTDAIIVRALVENATVAVLCEHQRP